MIVTNSSLSTFDSNATFGSDYLSLETINYAKIASLLRCYGKQKHLSKGRMLHDYIKVHKLDCNTFIGNCLIGMYGSCGSVKDAQATFDVLDSPNTFSWNILLNAYAQNGLLEEAQSVFDKILNPNTYSWNTLLKAYSTGGSLQKVQTVFREMPCRDVVSWTTMISAMNSHGFSKESIQLFHEMRLQTVEPNKVTFVCVLDACAEVGNLNEGRDIHAVILGTEFYNDIEIANTLIDMYGKCGSLEDARIVFEKMHFRDVVTYNAMLGALNGNGFSIDAMNTFLHFVSSDIFADIVTYLHVLHACGNLGSADIGKEIHAMIVSIGSDQDLMVVSSLITMYGKCGDLCHALHVFNTSYEKDVIIWNAIITTLSENCQEEEALKFFYEMQVKGLCATRVTFMSAFDACSNLSDIDMGFRLHSMSLEKGFLEDVMIGNALINMYGKCGSLLDAHLLFNRMQERDVISWNTMIAAFTQNELGKKALGLFHCMQNEGVKPDELTFLSCLSACADLEDIDTGREIHMVLEEEHYPYDMQVNNALVHMYGLCGSVSDAWVLFDKMEQKDVTSWNAMLSGLSHNRKDEEVLDVFSSMQYEGIVPDVISFLCALNGCVGLSSMEDGQYIHSAMVSFGQEENCILGSILIRMYVKCGAWDDAEKTFNKISQFNTMPWNMMIASFSELGCKTEAFYYFDKMQLAGVMPDIVTFTCILTCCARIADLEEGRRVHAAAIDAGFEQDTAVGNALISMYGKCGCRDAAAIMFDRLTMTDVVSWNAIIATCAQNGHDEEALNLFNKMIIQNVQPDQVTFVCVLKACIHTGQVDCGRHLFISMEKDFGIGQKYIHYSYMIDLLSRAGHLAEAEEMLNTMPFKRVRTAWLHILGACQTHRDLKRALRAASFFLQIGATQAGPYVMLSNIYASVTEVEEDCAEPIKESSGSHLGDMVLDDILHIEVCKLTKELHALT